MVLVVAAPCINSGRSPRWSRLGMASYLTLIGFADLVGAPRGFVKRLPWDAEVSALKGDCSRGRNREIRGREHFSDVANLDFNLRRQTKRTG